MCIDLLLRSTISLLQIILLFSIIMPGKLCSTRDTCAVIHLWHAYQVIRMRGRRVSESPRIRFQKFICFLLSYCSSPLLQRNALQVSPCQSATCENLEEILTQCSKT